MYVKHFILPALLLFCTAGFAQGVAIGTGAATPDASAALDIQSNQKGLLIPRMSQAQRDAILSPATGLLIYQNNGTPGFYYNSGSPSTAQWTPLPTAVWRLGGNAGTDPSLNFIGTADANPLNFRTNNIARMNIRANGQIILNANAPVSSTDALSVFGAGYPGATSNFSYPISGYSSGIAAGIYGENTGGGYGLYGANIANGAGVLGVNVGSGIGVQGQSMNNAGVEGTSFTTGFSGVLGRTNQTNGTGVSGLGNNLSVAIMPVAGAGVVANGREIGSYSVATHNTEGIGVVGLGNGMTSNYDISGGAGVLGQGVDYGVVGLAGLNTSPAVETDQWGGFFNHVRASGTPSWIAGRLGNTDYGILSLGVKSTLVKDEQNRNRVMFCTEAPEVLFQDVGTGQLVNGRAHITIDPLLARNIYVSSSRPLKVFIQPEGDCKGVYVTNKSAAGFDVIETQGGTSNTPFTYQLIANRANGTDEAGRVTSKFDDIRFPLGPVKMKIVTKDAMIRQVSSAEPGAKKIK